MIDIDKVAIAFRKAIDCIMENREFDYKDRMSNFPKCSCDDTCDILGYYLDCHGIKSRQLIKIYKPDDKELKCYHAVLLLDDDTIIDLTGDQFLGRPPVFVGKQDRFYEDMDYFEICENYNIEQDLRLWDNYKKILRYLNA